MSKPHLAPAPADGAPTVRSSFEQLEIPTGGQTGIGGLLHELARHAFPGGLAGFDFSIDGRGPRCILTVRTSERLTPALVDEGRTRILRALLGFGILKPAAPAEPSPAEPAEAEDGAPSPAPPPQSPPT